MKPKILDMGATVQLVLKSIISCWVISMPFHSDVYDRAVEKQVPFFCPWDNFALQKYIMAGLRESFERPNREAMNSNIDADFKLCGHNFAPIILEMQASTEHGRKLLSHSIGKPDDPSFCPRQGSCRPCTLSGRFKYLAMYVFLAISLYRISQPPHMRELR